MEKPYKTITLRVTPSQHRDLKLASFQSGRTLKDLLLEAVEYIRQDKREEIEAAKKTD